MKNCASHALKLNVAVTPCYETARKHGINASIQKLAQAHNREIRELKSIDSPLKEDEWMIVFFGFWTSVQRIFGYKTEVQEFHFVLRNDDGSWSQRDFGGPIEAANIEKMLQSAEGRENVPYKIYAVRKTA